MIRVVVVEDQTLVRQGIIQLLTMDPSITVVGEASDGREALACIPEQMPDVVLLDIRMPRMSGLDLLRALKALGRLPPTLVLTTFDDDEALFEALASGAKGFLLKDVSLEHLSQAIHFLAAGGSLVQPGLTERAKQRNQALDPGRHLRGPLGGPLTEKEREVLRMMAGGFSNREIGKALGLAEGTVKNHVSMILHKMDVRDRTRAVLKALELGLI